MKNLKTALRTGLKRTGYLALACGFPLAAVAQSASPSYSSSSYVPSSYNLQYGNGQYNNGQYTGNPYGNGPYNNRRTPRYTGHSRADHLVLEGGGGVTAPGGDTQNYANTGWNVLAGIGYRFNHRLSLLAEWNFNYMFVPHSLANVSAGTPDGNEHIWTIDLNPKFDFIRGGRADAYVIGGGGFSRALTNFTVPVLFYCYDYYFGGYPCSGDVTVAHTSSNQGNVDIGLGGEWRLSPYDRTKLFLEARYEKLFSPNNGLPPGQNATLIPVTVGFRW